MALAAEHDSGATPASMSPAFVSCADDASEAVADDGKVWAKPLIAVLTCTHRVYSSSDPSLSLKP